MTLNESISYYRNQLPETSKRIYDVLYEEIKKDLIALSYEFTIKEKCSVNDCMSAYKALMADHPELYILEYGEYITVSKGNIVRFQSRKTISKGVQEHICKEMEKLTSSITEGTCGHSAYAKEFIIYTKITKMISYGNTEEITHSILGPVLTRQGSCDGRAKLLALCLRAVGIPCIVVSDDEHMWNLASINGHNVWLDCTYETVLNGRPAYFYFNLDDNQLLADHVIPEGSPRCVDRGYDYFSVCGLSFTSIKDAAGYIRKEFKRGSKTISFKISGADETILRSALKKGMPILSKGCRYSMNESKDAMIISFY